MSAKPLAADPAAPDDAPRLVEVDWGGRSVAIEHAWIGSARRDAPLFVFLHEGLGSLAMWKDFPRALCDALGVRGLVYSRPGYGASTPRPPDERWDVDFMHRQAHEVLPAFLAAVGVGPSAPAPWLFGHSDGGSIALLYAARFPGRVAGLAVLAPHVFVEDVGLASIDAARQTFLTGNLRDRLARYHRDVDSAFWGWNDIWLHPPFRRWNIEEEIAAIRVPVLAVQGRDDEYGTLAQVEGVAKAVPGTRVVVLDDCGHSPHKDQPARLVEEVARFHANPGAAGTGSSPHQARQEEP
ncbi:MAG: alpha/beta hydrolase [Betaproteobacteria bacterium]|nr:alpha/beta hydrolase [Betaproteobacteria bacterium]MDH5285766.1 alpha/beta hydrolase [Betaproteobacteria bacterium]